MAWLFRRKKSKIPSEELPDEPLGELLDEQLESLPKEIADVCRRLQQNDPTMTELRLGNKKIGNKETKAIAQALKMNTMLQRLDLDGNQISDDGAKALAEALKMNTVLQRLYLNDNQISDDGAKALAEALKMNTVLQWLFLGLNQISDVGAKALAQALKKNTMLQQLYLYNNQISDDGAKALAEALKMNTVLQLLYLNGNQISDDGANAIVAALTSRDNGQLKVLWMGMNCDRATAVTFVRALVDQKFPNLEYIDFVPLNQYLAELRLPREYADKDNEAILAFLRERWESGEQALAVTKVIVTGPGEAGKTCLVSRLVRDEYPTSPPPPMTNGMLEERIVLGVDESGLELVFYDFGGQSIYATTHQLFLRSRAVFVVVWDNRQTDSQLFHRYAEDVLDASPKARIIFVTTKSDMGHASLSSDEVADLQQKYNRNFAGYVHTSAQAGTGAIELTEKIKNVAKSVMDDIGATVGINDMLVPKTYIRLRRNLEQLRKSGKFFLKEDEWNSYANDANIVGEDRVDRALTLFHEIGEVLCLPTGEIVLDPPELAKVLARVVSRDMRYVQNAHGGYLRHGELASVWDDYPAELYDGFLKLIHECEVGFPICDDDGRVYEATLIPAMLSRSGSAMETLVEELVVENPGLKQHPTIAVELSTQSRRLWPELQTKLRGVTMIGGWWKNGCVVIEAHISGGRKILRSFGVVVWKEADRLVSIITHGQVRFLQHRILQALTSCLKDFPGADLVRLDVKCASRLASGNCCGGWGVETLRHCRLKAAICSECGVACDVDKVADWLVRFEEQRQYALDLEERLVPVEQPVSSRDHGLDSRADTSDSLSDLIGLLEKHANSPDIVSYLLLARQKDLLTTGCDTGGRLRLPVLWLIYEAEGDLYAYPFCPHLEWERVRLDDELKVSGVEETHMARSNPQQTALNSVVEVIQERLKVHPLDYDARFKGIFWKEQTDKCTHLIRNKAQTNFVPVTIPEIGKVWVHEKDERYLSKVAGVQVSFIKHLNKEVLDHIANDSSIFISHTGQDTGVGNFAANLHDKLEDKEILSFCDACSLHPSELWKERIRWKVGKCAVFVAILSPTYFKRYWCMHELDLAIRQDRIVFPVYYGQRSGPNDLPRDRDEFLASIESDVQVEQDELERWWSNISRIPAINDIRMSSFANTKNVEVALKNAVVEEIRKLLE